MMIAWFDILESDAAAATRLVEAALRAGLSPAAAVRLTRGVFRVPAPAPAFATRWRGAGRPQLQAAA